MRILPISYNLYNQTRCRSTKKASQNSTITNTVAAQPVYFTASAPYAEPLRLILPHNIPDLYSSIILLDPARADELFAKQVFSRSLAQISWDITPITSSLFNIEYKFFSMLKRQAKRKPDQSLQAFVQEIAPVHREKLKALQKPILKDIEAFAPEFPGDLLEQFNYFMYVSEQKLNDKPVFIPFSVKEFRYKLNNIKKRIVKTAQSEEEINTIMKLQNIAGSIIDVPKEKRLSSGFQLSAYEDKQKVMIKKFADYLERSTLAYDKDLIELTDNSEKRIHKEKADIKFNRKSFIYDLQEITDRLENRKLAHLVNKTAISLPTSKENLSAFIIKASNRSDEQIGFDLLSGSYGTVDHLKASHNGGLDTLSNYALASAYKNSLKAHKSFAEFYRQDPMIAEYAARQIDWLIYLANSYPKIFKEAGLHKSYIKHLAKTLEKLSKDPTLIFDTRRL